MRGPCAVVSAVEEKIGLIPELWHSRLMLSAWLNPPALKTNGPVADLKHPRPVLLNSPSLAAQAQTLGKGSSQQVTNFGAGSVFHRREGAQGVLAQSSAVRSKDGGDHGPSFPVRSTYNNGIGDRERGYAGGQPAVAALSRGVAGGALLEKSHLEYGLTGGVWAGGAGGGPAYGGGGYDAEEAPSESVSHPLCNTQTLDPPWHAATVEHQERDKKGWMMGRRTAQLRWNPAWDGTDSALTAGPPDHQLLPLIRLHRDPFPRSAADELEAHCFPQDKMRGGFVRPLYGPVDIPVERQKTEVEYEKSFYRRPIEDKSRTYADCHHQTRYSVAPSCRNELGAQGVAHVACYRVAGGDLASVARESRSWQHEAGGHGPIPKKAVGDFGRSVGDVRSTMDDPTGPLGPIQDVWKRDVSAGPRAGLVARAQGEDEVRRYRSQINERCVRYDPSGNRGPAAEYQSGSRRHFSSETRMDPGAPNLPRCVPGNDYRAYHIPGEGIAPRQRYRDNPSSHRGVNDMLEERSPQERRGEGKLRYNFSRSESVRDRRLELAT